MAASTLYLLGSATVSTAAAAGIWQPEALTMPNRKTRSDVERPIQRFSNYGNAWTAHGSIRGTTLQSKDLGLHIVFEGFYFREKAVAGTASQSGHFGRFVQ